MLIVAHRPRLLILLTALLVAVAGVCRALEPTTPLARLGRQSWTVENGLPQNTVSTLLQSRSGYLWAGTELGLARFDGMSFRVFDRTTTEQTASGHASASFPDAEIHCILDSSDGSLWTGTSDGLVRMNGGHTTLFTTRDGLPPNSVRGLSKTSDKSLWVWTEGGIAYWDGKQFQSVAGQPNAPSGNRPIDNEQCSEHLITDSSGLKWPAKITNLGQWRMVLRVPRRSEIWCAHIGAQIPCTVTTH